MVMLTGDIEADFAGRVTLKRPEVADAVATSGAAVLLTLTMTFADGVAVPQSSPAWPACRTIWLA
jgi:hypothetical protein